MQSTLPMILLSVLCGVSGQLTLKAGMTQVGRIGAETLSQPFQLALRVLSCPFVLGGLALYALGAVSWLMVLSRLPLSAAYPVLAITYAVIPFLAWLVFGESVSVTRWLGIVVICVGIVIVSQS